MKAKFLFALLLLVSLLPYSSRASDDALAENQARFGLITGDVGLLAQGASEWIEPHEGLPIESGDHIRTGEDGHVDIIAGENEVWVLEPESELEAEHVETNAGRFNLSSGTLLGTVDSERTAGVLQRWEFNTPAALISIRGTEFGIMVLKSEGSHLGVFKGTVDLAPAETEEGTQPPVKVTTGQEGIVRRKKGLIVLPKMSPAMKNLTAEERLLKQRQIMIQNTWSPFTPQVRADSRKKYVAAPQKPRHQAPRPARQRRTPSPSSEN